MRREDCVEMFKRIPERYHAQVNVVLRNQAIISVDLVVRQEPNYLVIRGREGGNTEEGRAFFIPYEEIAYIRIERMMKLSEIKKMFGETGHVDAEDKLGQEAEAEAAAAAQVEDEAPDDGEGPPSPMVGLDPAAIAKQNLLERIRAARASATGKLAK